VVEEEISEEATDKAMEEERKTLKKPKSSDQINKVISRKREGDYNRRRPITHRHWRRKAVAG